ncbi:polyphosphate--glucose phosphotransferase [Corynebacterium mayonis]|uniref:polyphosphate--glucose phosphotransferase n=1 Tax=Corynebacterium mayonis TaxID=3062461 RepID=UPI003140849A
MTALTSETFGSDAYSFGVDVGGSGIKGAVVDLSTGEFVGERMKVTTPQPATPQAVAAVIAEVVQRAEWAGPVGVALPSVIKGRSALTAANIDQEWIGTNVYELLRTNLGDRDYAVLNDADAAGLAEVAFGDPQTRQGSVVFLTFGTGIGSALLVDGTLFPNTELGHMVIGGREAEHFASSAVREREDLSYKVWASRVSTVIKEYERLLNPTAFVVGGGISRKADKWVPLLEVNADVFPARLRNRAGIVGAAMAARDHVNP